MKHFFKYQASRVWRRVCPDAIVQRRIGDSIFTISARDHVAWLFDGEKASHEPEPPVPNDGPVWDLGCNIGLYAVRAAQAGCRVTAFDISLTNVLCLRQTAQVNGLNIKAVHAPVTVTERQWSPAETGHTEERLNNRGDRVSFSFREAEKVFGQPGFIKMDIEGAEEEFLRSGEFKRWVMANQVSVYIEVHDGNERFLWKEFRRVGERHWVLRHG